MSGGTLSSLIGFWNQQNSEPLQPPKREPIVGRVKRWEIPSSCNQIRKGDVCSSRKWEPGSSNKREIPTVICTPPVNKWEGSGGFVLGLEGCRGSEGSERSDGSDNKEEGKVEKVDLEDGEVLMGKLGASTYSTTSAPQTPTIGQKSPLLGHQSPSAPSSPGGTLTPSSPFYKFRELDKQVSESKSESLVPIQPKAGAVLYRNSSMPASPRPKSLVSPTPVARSGSNAKEVILTWVQSRLKDYPIPISNFSVCWNDGLAFCALIHVFYPDNFDWYALKSENRRYNFTLGFDKAEELADIYPLLEVDDMVKYQKPDWKCVFTYVQSFYRRFRDTKAPTPNILHNQEKQSKDKVNVTEEDLSSDDDDANLY